MSDILIGLCIFFTPLLLIFIMFLIMKSTKYKSSDKEIPLTDIQIIEEIGIARMRMTSGKWESIPLEDYE